MVVVPVGATPKILMTPPCVVFLAIVPVAEMLIVGLPDPPIATGDEGTGPKKLVVPVAVNIPPETVITLLLSEALTVPKLEISVPLEPIVPEFTVNVSPTASTVVEPDPTTVQPAGGVPGKQ